MHASRSQAGRQRFNPILFSPDGLRIVTASADQTARVWDVPTGKAPGILAGHEGGIESAQFSLDGTRHLADEIVDAAVSFSGAPGANASPLLG